MRLSPISVPYRALQKASTILVALFFVGTSGTIGGVVAIGIGAAVASAALAYEAAYYRRFEYEFTADTFDVRSGVISRRDREIPYGRIQNVDVSRNVLQRLLGIAAVDLETAGGSSTEGAIRYVSAERADELQREIRRRKASRGEDGEASGFETAAGSDVDGSGDSIPTGDTETELFSLSPTELALVGALSFDPRLIGVLAFLGSGSVPVLSGYLPTTTALVVTITGVIAVGLLLVASWLIGAAVAITNYYGFRLTRSGDDLRYERGLFKRYSGSIPTDKVQSLTIADNPAKRLAGYATLTIETAGYAPGQGGTYGSQAAVPLARTDRVRELARDIETFGDPEFRRPPGRVRVRYAIRYAAIVAVLTAVAFGVDRVIAAPIPWYGAAGLVLLAPVAAHYKWVHRGYWLGENHLLTRVGFWKRETRIVPYYRIQTVIDRRTVFQRRWGIATVVADTAGSGGFIGRDAAALDVDAADADRLREDLTVRLRSALADRRARGASFTESEPAETESGEHAPDTVENDTSDAAEHRTSDAAENEAATGGFRWIADEEPSSDEEPASDEKPPSDENPSSDGRTGSDR
ncbi:PH domain-containing protein [Halopenitus persicus]|uniref:Putative membrane protein n=1 Tax=Halopenitus persicus TaxID=1048396 RepID=A0A1H3H613_9EURY|nr:PH domain-containing protein [Halopenitus persicus]SDY10867.1 putative membrane protein [Halopenitus persicus]